MSNILDCLFATLFLEQMFAVQRNCERGEELMTKNEQELMDMIRNSEDPQQALMTAVDIICCYLAQLGSSLAQQAVDRPESA